MLYELLHSNKEVQIYIIISNVTTCTCYKTAGSNNNIMKVARHLTQQLLS